MSAAVAVRVASRLATCPTDGHWFHGSRVVPISADAGKESLYIACLPCSGRDARLSGGRNDDAGVVRPREAGASWRELLIVALLLDVQEHRQQAHDTHARHEAGRGETLFERVDGLSAGVDAEAAVWVRHCVDNGNAQSWD